MRKRATTRKKSKSKQKPNRNAQKRKQDRSQNKKAKGELNHVFGVASVVCLSILFVVAFGFCLHFLQAGALNRALWFGVASAIFAVFGVAFYVQGFVIKPLEAKESPLPQNQTDQRPAVFFKHVRWRNEPKPGQPLDVEFLFTNTGSAAYTLTTRMSAKLVAASFEGLLNYDGLTEIREGPLEHGADFSITPEIAFKLSEEQIKALENETSFLVLYGHVWWKDSLGREGGFPFCRCYSKRFYPSLPYCPDKLKVAEDVNR